MAEEGGIGWAAEAAIKKLPTGEFAKRLWGTTADRAVVQRDSERVKEEVGIEAIEFNHDPCSDGEPDRRKDRGGGEEFLHGCVVALMGDVDALEGGISAARP